MPSGSRHGSPVRSGGVSWSTVTSDGSTPIRVAGRAASGYLRATVSTMDAADGVGRPTWACSAPGRTTIRPGTFAGTSLRVRPACT